ncbi:MHJ_0274 family protein [Mycoplasma seminis]|uniref:Uncharacterized protein n=1 Tax=Mycoplasma seminis TaxID=512749 RepID=A0ABY9HE06_9MOLU|nr:hypothetical protein [Mycoplasma seminis]WLP85908.1 hypothetical protein Q8852_02060 [Mycoplasma seminis]
MGFNVGIWIFFAIVMSLFLAWVVWQYVKDKRRQKKTKLQAAEFAKESAIYVYDLTIMMNELFKLNRQTLDEFVPSIGKYTMGEINANTRNLLIKIQKSPEYREFLHENPKYHEFNHNFTALRDLNANLWDKKGTKYVEYFINYVQSATDEVEKHNKTEIETLFKEESILINQIQEAYNNEFQKHEQTQQTNSN